MREINSIIIEILRECISGIEISEKQEDSNLIELGLDSISLIHIIVAIEEKFGVEIPDEYLVLNEMDTINKIAHITYDMLDK
mgnify:CR=1 FL=1